MSVDPRKVQEIPEFIYDDRIKDEQPEYLRAPGIIDVVDFGNMISRLLRNLTLPSEYWDPSTRVVVSPEYPDLMEDNLLMPQIIWDVVSRVPFEKDPKPRRRNVNELDADRNSPIVNIHNVQRFDNTMEFLCIDRDNYKASRLQEFFEDFMELHLAIFQDAGVSDVLYDSRINDRVLSYRERVNDKYGVRTTRYRVLTQVLRVFPRTRLQHIDVRASAGYYIRVSERVTRGSGDYDTLDRATALFIKGVRDDISNLHSTYQKDVDYYLGSDSRIYWITGGDAPTEGAEYFVSYLHSDTIEAEDKADIVY